jgi:hypothetical protein
MSTPAEAVVIARYLAAMWNRILPNAGEYLHRQFGFPLAPVHRFLRLFICQMSDANVSTNDMGGMYARKWVMANDSLDEVALDFAYNEMYDTDESDNVFASPSYLFGYDSSGVLLSERYGPQLILRRRGKIIADSEPLEIEWQTLWCIGPAPSGPSASDYNREAKRRKE